jgi:hypothetical protein
MQDAHDFNRASRWVVDDKVLALPPEQYRFVCKVLPAMTDAGTLRSRLASLQEP